MWRGVQRPVYGGHGQPIATVSQARSVYLTSLLAEWLEADAVCPWCCVLLAEPEVQEIAGGRR